MRTRLQRLHQQVALKELQRVVIFCYSNTQQKLSHKNTTQVSARLCRYIWKERGGQGRRVNYHVYYKMLIQTFSRKTSLQLKKKNNSSENYTNYKEKKEIVGIKETWHLIKFDNGATLLLSTHSLYFHFDN